MRVVKTSTIREALFFAADTVLFSARTCSRDNGRKKVLVVRLDAIGDFVVWLDAARALRELYPHDEYHVTLVGNDLWAALAAETAIFDEVWPLNRRLFTTNLRYRLSMLRKVRSAGFGVAIHPTYAREFLYGDAIVRASGAPQRIGSAGTAERYAGWQPKWLSDRWYTRLIPAASGPTMELIRGAEFMRGLGLSEFRAGIPRLPVRGDLPRGMQRDDYYVLFPGAGVGQRQWPVQNFAVLAQRIFDATGWTGLVCGGPGEEHLGDALVGGAAAPLQNWVAKTSLSELVRVIAGARILVANETSAVHIAAAVSTPSVCILGGGHYGRFVPYRLERQSDGPLPRPVYRMMDCFGCNWRCPHCSGSEMVAPCIAGVTVDDVWDAVVASLDSTPQV